MPSIDERVVAMSFENSVFEARVATTMATLGKLDVAIKNIGSANGLQNIEASANKVTLQGPLSALDKLKAKLGLAGQGAGQGFSDIERAGHKVTLEGPSSALDKLKAKFGQLNAGTTFTDIEKAADRTTLSGLTNALDNVTNKFSVLQGAASVALGNITSQAAMKGAAFAKSFAFGPITQGLQEYQTNLNSIQTILANTQGQQVSGLDEVNKHLDELNHYSDQTIYNFSEMAKNIGTFTAAGVDMDKSTQSIKGIANLAALSGSNSQQASTAMYQLSQAIAAGRVGLQDWNSVVNAGMGGAVFQKSLMRTAENMGAIAKGAVHIDKATGKATVNGQSFRNSIMAKPGEESWLTSDVLVETLKQFTGDMKEADLIAQGFSKTQAHSIILQAATAKAAATEVKTLSQAFDVAKETIGSGWSATFKAIFGDFEESKKTFTELSNTINKFINVSSDARNKVLGDWKALGGRTALIDGFKAAFAALAAVLKPIGQAFRDIFPKKTGADLAEMTRNFRDFMQGLKIGPETADALKRTFAGLFAVLHIGWSIVKEVVGVIFDLLGVVGKGSGGFLNFTGSIGDFLVALDSAITKGGALTGIFKSIGAVLRVPLELIKALASALFNMFDGSDPKKAQGVSDSMDHLNKALLPLRGILDDVYRAWGKFLEVLNKIRATVEPAFTNVLNFLGNFGNFVADKFQSINWDRALTALETGLIGGIFLKLKAALSGGLNIDIGGGVFKNLNEGLGALTNNLRAMQRNIQANTLLQIAIAIGVLAAGVLVLSSIPADKLSTAMSAVALGLAQLVGAMYILSKAASGPAFLQMPLIAGSMILLATAITILAGAMKIMATMDWEQLAKGLVGVGGAIAAVGLGAQLINGPKILVAAAALIPLAIGLNILAVAMKIFATMSFEEIGKGLEGVVLGLAAVAMGVSIMPPSVLLIGPGLVAVAFALTMLAGAVGTFGKMDMKQMGQGILGIATALVAIAYSIGLIPPTVALQAAGLVILALALNGIAAAVAIFGNMDIGTLVKGIISVAATLDVLAFGLTAMAGTLPGSVALLAAAAAFAILGPAIGFMGQLKIFTMVKGLILMAATLAVLAVAGTLAAAPITALGIALAILGGGMLAISAALSLFVLALAQLGAKGPKNIALMVAAFGAFLLVLPKMIIDFVKGLVIIVAEIAKLAPAIATSLVSIVGTLLTGIADLAPKIRVAISALVVAILGVLVDNTPRIINAGFTLLLALLSGISENIGLVVANVATIITSFLTTLTGHSPALVQSGVKTLISFLSGITGHLPELVATVAKMIGAFIVSVGSHIPKIVATAGGLMLKFIGAIVGFAPKIVAAGLSSLLSFLGGIAEAIPRLTKKGLEVAARFLNGIADGLSGLASIGFRAIIRFLNGLEAAIRANFDNLVKAGAGVADAIIDGLVDQFGKLGGVLRKALESVFQLLPGWAKKILGISSPSKVFMEIGKLTMQGLIVGIRDSDSAVGRTMQNAAGNVVNAAKSSFGNMPNLLEGIMDVDPVITPVLDLSNVEKDARKLGDLTNVVPITAAASFGQASAASQEVSAAQQGASEAVAAGIGTFSFVQNNTSPEALSDVEIYRQTKNQLGQIKSVLGLVS